MYKSNDRLMKNEKKDSQKMITIRKIIISASIALYMLGDIHTAEEDKKDSIPFYVTNTIWDQETELMVKVFYESKPEPVEFSLILGGINSETRSPTQSKFLEKGKINKFSLFLQNYYAESRDIIGTLLASLNFKPRDLSLEEMTFQIQYKKLIPTPTYANLPPKFEKDIHNNSEIK